MRTLATVLALSLTPALLPAQHVASARAGITPRTVFAVPPRADTTSHASTRRPHTQLRHAVIGGVTGLAVGALYGRIHASDQERRCAVDDDLCGLNELDVPLFALTGTVVGTVIGLVWPTH